MIIFAIDRYDYLANSLAEKCGFVRGDIERKFFPDGESYHRIADQLYAADVILVGGTIDDRASLEIFDIACTISSSGARSLRMVVPYFGYSTMERAVRRGEIVKAKTRIKLLSAIPRADLHNEVILLDLHTEGLPYYFENNAVAVHLYAKSLILAAARRWGGENYVLAATDAGRAKWVQSLANEAGVEAAFVYKRRISGSDTSLTGINAAVEGRNVVIYDDMIRTGGSLIKAAQAYKEKGAQKIVAIATHGLLPSDAINRLADCRLFEKIIVTNSHPRVLELRHEILEIADISTIVGDYLLGKLSW
jgi:ribose-phosphate pyrophosphokinase